LFHGLVSPGRAFREMPVPHLPGSPVFGRWVNSFPNHFNCWSQYEGSLQLAKVLTLVVGLLIGRTRLWRRCCLCHHLTPCLVQRRVSSAEILYICRQNDVLGSCLLR